MMVEIRLKSDPSRPGWYMSEEIPSSPKSRSRWRMVARAHLWRPPTDVYETNDTLVVRVEIGGMVEEDFSISLTGRQLSIRGVRADIQERRAYHRMEIYFGEFLTEVELPCPIQVDKVSAEYRSGFLHVIMSKETGHVITVSQE
jgi:HSP20 family protein